MDLVAIYDCGHDDENATVFRRRNLKSGGWDGIKFDCGKFERNTIVRLSGEGARTSTERERGGRVLPLRRLQLKCPIPNTDSACGPVAHRRVCRLSRWEKANKAPNY